MIIPYLSFTGSCREAFTLYARAFGGKIEFSQTYGEAPQDPNTGEQNRNQVRHAMVSLGDHGVLMGSDAAWPVQPGSAVSIGVRWTELEEARRAFGILAEEGQVIAPLEPFEDEGHLGALCDRFGFVWQFIVGAADA